MHRLRDDGLLRLINSSAQCRQNATKGWSVKYFGDEAFPIAFRGIFLALAFLLTLSVQAQSTVEVCYTKRLSRSYLVLRAMHGNIVAHGDLAQVARGERVTSHQKSHG